MRPYLRVANVLEDRIDTTNVLTMNFTPEEYEIYALHPGDILLNDGQSPELVGRPALYRGEIPGACYQNHLIRFRSRGAVEPEYALLVFRCYLHAGRFRDIARWTTNIATLSVNRFSAMPFPLPPLEEQQRIVAEARRRLDASAQQEEAVRASLARLPEMEREMLDLAVSGTLVDGGEYGESASELLERVGPPPKELKSARAVHDLDEGDSRMTTPASADARHDGTAPLAEVLAAAGRPLSLPDLLQLAGFDKDRGADVERFYLELRSEIGRTLRVSDGASENAVVEVMHDAAD